MGGNPDTESKHAGESTRGRILKMRLGVNPNSSGHGMLFGSLFFIPYSVLSSIVANAVISNLDDALVSYRDARSEPSRRDRALTTAVWTLAWAGFVAIWAVFLSSMIMIGAPIWGWVLLGVAATLPITFSAYRAAVNQAVVLLAKRCPKPCLWGLVLGVFTVAVFEPSGVSDVLGVILPYAYATPLAIVLAVGAARAAGIIRRVANLSIACIAYVMVGLVLVFPMPPISTTAYNPVGFFFPLWGFGAPWAIAVLSLMRLTMIVDLGPDASETVDSLP